MDLRSAKYRLDQIENKIDYLKDKKEELKLLVLPKAKAFNEIKVDGGNIPKDKLLEYECKLQDIEDEMEALIMEYKHLNKWYSRELEIIGQYDPLIQQIVIYREQKKYKWDVIARYMGYSKRQCIRFYNKYKNKQ